MILKAYEFSAVVSACEKGGQTSKALELFEGMQHRLWLGGKEGSQAQKKPGADGSNLQATTAAADLSEALATCPDPPRLGVRPEKERNKICSNGGEYAILWNAEEGVAKRRERWADKQGPGAFRGDAAVPNLAEGVLPSKANY